MPTHTIKLIFLFLLIAFCLCSQSSFAQQADETKRGIEFYNQGKDAEAIESLKSATKKNKDDIEAWHYLGLSLERVSRIKDASKAHKEAVEQMFEMLEKAYKEESKGKSPAPFLEFLISKQTALLIAASSAEKFISINESSNSLIKPIWESAKISFTELADIGRDNARQRNVFSVREITTEAKISSKYVHKNRKDLIKFGEGKGINLLLILQSDGKVGKVVSIKPLITETPDELASDFRNLQFIPAEKSDVRVSQIAFAEIDLFFLAGTILQMLQK